MDYKLLRDLHDIFGHRSDPQIIISMAARPPLRYSALARAIIEETGSRLADAEITRALPRLEAAGLVTADGPKRRRAYRLTPLGRERASKIKLLAATMELDAVVHPDDQVAGASARRLRATKEQVAGIGPVAATVASMAGPPPTTVDVLPDVVPSQRLRHEDVAQLFPTDSQSIDTTTPHSARRYNHWLGGKDNFAVDRESADEIEAKFPNVRLAARENRDFLRRAVQFLVDDAGIRQFLDIGTGLPVADNTHEVAQAIAPESRVVYVDNDPLVLNHARALLNSAAQGMTSYLQADLRDPAAILRHPEVANTLDMKAPIALMLVAVLHFIPGEGAAKPLVDQLMNALPSGSYLVVTHTTFDFATPEQTAVIQTMMDQGRLDAWPRSRAEILDLFVDLRLSEPGLVPLAEWRRDDGQPPPSSRDVAGWAAIGRKP